MQGNESRIQFNSFQQTAFVLLRIAIGWHFLREGFVKLSHPSWTATGYLTVSWGPFADMMHGFASNPAWMGFINVFIPWALFLGGLGLMLGLFTRISIVVGMGLLAMFYFATPPWPWELTISSVEEWSTFINSVDHAQWAANQLIGNEGNYIIVNKNMIEFLALGALLTIDSGKMAGFDVLIHQWLFGRDK